MKKIFLLLKSILSIAIISQINCSKAYDLQIFKNSHRPEIDLFLIVNKFNVIETDWVNTKNDARFLKQDLVRHLKSYGRTLEDLKNNKDLNYRENEDVVIMNIGKTSHATHYNYDANIPISFYGKKWFKEGEYSEVIHQQNITPTLSKILKIRNPNGVEAKPLTNVLQQNILDKPDIIVTVVIDQGGQQYYMAHPDVPKNIMRIRNNSAYFPNAKVGHVDTQTAVGHMAIGTGAYPNKSTIISNTKFTMENNTLKSKGVYTINSKEVDTNELEVESLADVLDHENQNHTEVISQCYAIRASIGMAGHGMFKVKNSAYNGDKHFVYWLSKDGSWITDPRYYNLPESTKKYNSYDNFANEYPNGLPELGQVPREKFSDIFYEIMSTPSEIRMEGEMFRSSLQTEIINTKKNKDGHTDLAYITFKATDTAGHTYGWESLQAKEAFLETDNQIGLLFDMLQKEYGDNFIFIITADHGCAPLPEISGGSRMVLDDFIKEVNTLLPKDSNDDLIKFMTVGQVSLNHEIMKKHNITESKIKEKILSIKVDNKPFFKDIISASELK